MIRVLYLLLSALLLAACTQATAPGAQTSPAGNLVAQASAAGDPIATSAPAASAQPTATATTAPPTATAQSTATPAPPTATPAPPTATPDPFAEYRQWTIEAMRERQARGEFGTEGPIEIVRTLEDTPNFTRSLFAYRGDGLRLTGMLNKPKGPGPFPIVILVHGYYPLDQYQTGNGTKLAADYLANRGFMTLSPDLRSHAESDDAPNVFRAGHVIDVLNLIPLAQQLPDARPGKVGLWGHSNGGAIAAKVITVSDQVGAALIYAPASSTIAEDYQFRAERASARDHQSAGRRTGVIDTIDIEFPVKPDEAPDLYQRLSPLPYVQYADMPIQIQWGTADETVPRKWPEDLYNALKAAGKQVEWFEYPGEPHSFTAAGNQIYLPRMAEFFGQYIR